MIFIGPNIQFDKITGLSYASANIYYNHKNKFLIGAGIGYSFADDTQKFNVTIAIPLKRRK